MREHNVARDELTKGRETPANSEASCAIKLMHIGRDAIVDTVSRSAVAADDIEIFLDVELCALLR